MTAFRPIRLRAAALLAGLSLALSGCFISPGKFTSELQLLDNNQFTFSYDGEVNFVGLTQLMKEASASQNIEFRAYCYDENFEGAEEAVGAVEAAAEEAADDGDNNRPVLAEEFYEELGTRECTPEEEAEQRASWEARAAERAERDRVQMARFSQLIGGIDPADPDAEAELARRLERQKGFDRVIAKGNGLFEVRYAISGTLDHDYMFPMMEDFPLISPFLQMFIRDGDVVRVSAPAFAARSSSNPLLTLLAFGSPFGATGPDSNEQEALLNVPGPEGTFTIVTTGEIRANNTDEGPVAEAGRQRLTWTINERSSVAPTALIALKR